ncbi:MAG: MBL fold metallo-hydrolase [Acidobacteriota bacterium]|nr:MBL fold metallo-hydrolase [Acidobacteriota bacterium]
MSMLRLSIILLLLVTTVCGQADRGDFGPGTVQDGLTIKYIANEGISIDSGSNHILLDAIHRRYKPEYAFTPEDILSKIESSRYPYNRFNLILVSHNHGDHFNAESIAMHLMNNSSATLVSSDQVIDEVLKARDELAGSTGRKASSPSQFIRIKHEWKKSAVYEGEGLKVRFLGLLHANSKLPAYRDIQNFGHLIEIDGKKLLHIGDADIFTENFGSFGLENEVIDVAFVPYWFLLSKDGRAILNKELKAKTVVAIHVPPTGQSKTIRDILDSFPSAVVFSEQGEMLNY